MKPSVNRVRLACSLALVSGCGLLVGSLQGTSCCRELAEPVWYAPWGEGGPHYPGADYVQLIRVEAGKGVTLTVLVPSYKTALGYPPAEVFSTADYGKFWKDSFLEPAVTSAPIDFSSPYSGWAASDPNIRYRHLSDIGLNLSSFDGGKTWILPRHTIEGLSPDDFAARLAGRVGYHALFEIKAVHPHDPQTLYATVDAVPWRFTKAGELQWNFIERLYWSQDGGQTWNLLADGIRFYSPVGISKSNPSTMYAHGVDGVAKTTDGGQHWFAVGQQEELEALPLSLSDKDEGNPKGTLAVGLKLFRIVVDPTNDDIVYLVSNKGLYRTLDGGKTWCLLKLGFDEINGVNSLLLNPVDPRELFVGTSYGILHSKDRGCSFKKLPLPKARPF